MPRSNSSLGVAPGGSAVRAALGPGPAPGPGARGCGGNAAVGATGLVRLRSSGSPAPVGGSTDLSAAAELAQAILELPVAVLQFLVLAGELAKLVFQPLDPQFRVAIVGLGERVRGNSQRRGERHGPGNHMKSG